MSMATGNAPDQNGDLVQVVSREVFDYSIPPAPDPVPDMACSEARKKIEEIERG